MKSVINIQIHKSGSLNDSIVRMVTNNNEGKVKVDMVLIRERFKCYAAEWPSLMPDIEFENNDWGVLTILENKIPVLTLTWKEVYELSETENEIEAELEPDHGVIVLTIGEETAEETKERIDSNQEPDDIKDLFHASSQD